MKSVLRVWFAFPGTGDKPIKMVAHVPRHVALALVAGAGKGATNMRTRLASRDPVVQREMRIRGENAGDEATLASPVIEAVADRFLALFHHK